jgi:SHAQKYF class myb-like DNA-binding protein
MSEVKNLHSPKKISSINSNYIAPKPKIFMIKKINNLRLEKARENTIKFLSKKALRFVVEKNEEYNKKKLNENDEMNEGRWAEEEHDKFLDGIAKYGINWKKVKTMINSCTPVQVRSHAQKFYRKLKMCKDEQLGIDFTKDDISNIRDMIHQIKETNSNYSTKYIFKYLSDNFDEMKKSKKFGARNCTGNYLDSKDNKLKNSNIQAFNLNNFLINPNYEFNILNNFPQSLNTNQYNDGFPLNNNTLFNNFFDNKNNLTNLPLMNNLKNYCPINPNYNNYNNNETAINNILSNLNNPLFVSLVNKLINILNINNNNLINENLINGLNNNKMSDFGLNNDNNVSNMNLNIPNLDNNNCFQNINLNFLNVNNNFANDILGNNILNSDNIINNNIIRNTNINNLSQENYNINDNNINNLFFDNSINNISSKNNDVNISEENKDICIYINNNEEENILYNIKKK